MRLGITSLKRQNTLRCDFLSRGLQTTEGAISGFMAGAIHLPNITHLPGNGSKNALSCGPRDCTIVRSDLSSLSSTQPHGFRNFGREVLYHQLHPNEAYRANIQKWSKVEKLKTKEGLIARGVVSETAGGSEEKAEGATDKQHPYSHLQIGKRWQEIQGNDQWKGLLEPLDNALRGELMRYGTYTQATYDSFDFDTHSTFCGSCKFGKTRFFEKMGLGNYGYEVTDYLYATAGEGVPLAKHLKFMDVDPEEDPAEAKQRAWDLESNWIGYVAVTTDPNEIERLGRRDIVVVWRGTGTRLEWLEDFRDFTVPTGLDPRRVGQSGAGDLKVESGFLGLYKTYNAMSPYTSKSARLQLLEAITRLVRKYADGPELSITVLGHSLGSALAMLAGYDIAESGVNQPSNLPEKIPDWDDVPDKGRNPDQVVEWTRSTDVKTVPVTVYSFGGPRVGNDAFRNRVDQLGVKVLRVANLNDVVPKLPGLVVNENLGFLGKALTPFGRWLDSLPWTYTQVGVPLYVDNLASPFLKKTKNPNTAHNLEAYIHIVNGWHGEGKPFAQVIPRDLALVNKSADFIATKHYVPASWWDPEANKGLVKDKNGYWIPYPREKVDYPHYDLEGQREAEEILPPHLASARELSPSSNSTSNSSLSSA